MTSVINLSRLMKTSSGEQIAATFAEPSSSSADDRLGASADTQDDEGEPGSSKRGQLNSCVRSPKKVKLEGEDALAETAWFGDVLNSNPLILSSILNNFPAMTLNRMGLVCSYWRDMAQREIKRRNTIDTFYTQRPLRDNPSYLAHTGPRFLLPVTERRAFGTSLRLYFRTLRAPPRVVISFTTHQLADKTSRYFENFFNSNVYVKKMKRSLQATGRFKYNLQLSNYISSLLPVGCELMMSCAWGIIVTDVSGPTEIEVCEGLTTVCISDWPGVKFTSFRLFEEINEHLNSNFIQRAGLSDVRDAKAMICVVEGLPESDSYPAVLLEEMIEAHPSMALAGAAVFSFAIPDSDRQTPVCIGGFVIEGNCQAVSVLIGEHVRSSVDVRAAMHGIRNFPVHPKRSVGFLFTCSARGEDFHGSPNCESGVFKEMFPGVPLVGIFGSGEIGYNSFVSLAEDHRAREYNHSYSSIFLILTMNEPGSKPTEYRAESTAARAAASKAEGNAN